MGAARHTASSLDVLDVTQEASVAAYQRHARADLDAIADRGRVPILVGGSGLYVRAALDASHPRPIPASGPVGRRMPSSTAPTPPTALRRP